MHTQILVKICEMVLIASCLLAEIQCHALCETAPGSCQGQVDPRTTLVYKGVKLNQQQACL